MGFLISILINFNNLIITLTYTWRLTHWRQGRQVFSQLWQSWSKYDTLPLKLNNKIHSRMIRDT